MILIIIAVYSSEPFFDTKYVIKIYRFVLYTIYKNGTLKIKKVLPTSSGNKREIKVLKILFKHTELNCEDSIIEDSQLLSIMDLVGNFRNSVSQCKISFIYCELILSLNLALFATHCQSSRNIDASRYDYVVLSV